MSPDEDERDERVARCIAILEHFLETERRYYVAGLNANTEAREALDDLRTLLHVAHP